MTPTELRALILASGLTNSEFARRLGINPRHMRRMLAGEQPINSRMEAAINALFGGTDELNPYLPRDRWIVGEGPPPDRREYIIHTAAPRFIARVVAINETTGEPELSEEPADIEGGIVYEAGDSLLCEIQWIDPSPANPVTLSRLMDAAADQLEWDQ